MNTGVVGQVDVVGLNQRLEDIVTKEAIKVKQMMNCTISGCKKEMVMKIKLIQK